MENTAIRVVGPKLTIQLTCQAPMIHFQHDEKGATLRASEVKPKLDKYLVKKFNEEGKDFSAYRINDKSNALAYKLKIFSNTSQSDTLVNVPFYFAGKGKKLVLTDPTLEILCFNPELRTHIVKHIEAFFISHNFGFRSGKGFGSFLVTEINNQKLVVKTEEQITEILGLYYQSDVYVMSTNGVANARSKGDLCKMLKPCGDFYLLTKSGINDTATDLNNYKKGYVFKYMLEKGFGNEKAVVKSSGLVNPFIRLANKQQVYIKDISSADLSPIELEKYHKAGQKTKNPVFARGLLGLAGGGLSFANRDSEEYQVLEEFEKKRFVKYWQIGIAHDEHNKHNKINRFASPIIFKIIGNNVYIFAQEIPENILGEQFKFSRRNRFSKNEKERFDKSWKLRAAAKPVVVKTPKKFDLQDFLEKAIAYYNCETTVAADDDINFYKPVTIVSCYKRQETKPDK